MEAFALVKEMLSIKMTRNIVKEKLHEYEITNNCDVRL